MIILDWLKRLLGESVSLNNNKERAQPDVDEAGNIDGTVASGEVDEVDAFNPFPEPICLEISDIFDLHTIAPRDVARVVEEYLLEARRAGFRSVRIIHGKGKGVQREIVRGILARTPFVEEWTDAPPQAGGWGATVAHLLPGRDEQQSD